VLGLFRCFGVCILTVAEYRIKRQDIRASSFDALQRKLKILVSTHEGIRTLLSGVRVIEE